LRNRYNPTRSSLLPKYDFPDHLRNCGSVDCAEGLFVDPVWRKAILNVFAHFNVAEEILTDYDSDGIDDANDNCIAFPNPDQLDSFSDASGDVCDQHCH
jgi:hypothetical protein